MGGRGSINWQATRLDWVDVARGIGILAVVAGHVWTRGPLRDAAYSFHMPLFFLLSGMLCRPQPVGRFTMRQLVGQMQPYILFLGMLVLIDQIIEPMRGHRPIFHDWPADFAVLAYGGSALRGPYTTFWFVPCLMVGRIIHNMVAARWPDPRALPQVAIGLLSLALAYAVGAWTSEGPFGLIAVPMALFLLWVGAVWRGVQWRGWMIVPLGLLAWAGLSGMVPALNMKAAYYGWSILSIAAAIATSLLIFRLSVAIAPHASVLGALGRASLVIMYLHVAVIHYLSPFLGKPMLMLLGLAGPFAAYHAIRKSKLAARLLL
ncbi:acyltransferase family protein [Sphingobium aromaticiconvertens]|uniref:acyltransferase family protein n=1 Tax=Sphingobium aromaticiconvertens TaxID=365341 RepID=UPI003019B8C6